MTKVFKGNRTDAAKASGRLKYEIRFRRPESSFAKIPGFQLQKY